MDEKLKAIETMKLILGCLSLLFCQLGFSQNQKAIAFQAVARTNQGVIMPNKNMHLRVSLLNDTNENIIFYQELKAITTNPLGLFTILIGADEPSKIITIGDFKKMDWGQTNYFIRVEIDPEKNLHFTRIGQQQIHYVAYAFTADHIKASNLEGILSVAQGGTGFNNLIAFKQALQLDKVNNIPDTAKALSKASINALNNKLEKKDTVSLSNRINQKINKGEITSVDLETSLGFLPIELDFGHFFDTSRQIAPIQTATSVKWSDTSNNSHVYISNNTSLEPSRITVSKAGTYLVQYSLQVSNALINNDEISIWIRRNGSAYPNSLKQFLTGSIGVKNIFSGQAMVPLGDADYIELFFSVKNSQTQLLKTSSLTSPSRPATPSAQIQILRIQ